MSNGGSSLTTAFRALSVVAAGFGIFYLLLGLRAMVADEAGGVPLLAIGATAVTVGVLTWRWMGRSG